MLQKGMHTVYCNSFFLAHFYASIAGSSKVPAACRIRVQGWRRQAQDRPQGQAQYDYSVCSGFTTCYMMYPQSPLHRSPLHRSPLHQSPRHQSPSVLILTQKSRASRYVFDTVNVPLHCIIVGVNRVSPRQMLWARKSTTRSMTRRRASIANGAPTNTVRALVGEG